MKEDCIFCNIANGTFSSETIYEDEHVRAVLDIHPIAPGHTMILPKIHCETILDVADSEILNIFTALKKVTKILKECLNPDGFTIGINHGKCAGQAVDHLHIHIIPRWKNDGGNSIHSVVQNSPSESLTEIKNRIINNKHGN
ncbi:MAG: HIT family protein [Candidatus Paceibacterota bacterium]|jgi:histidine triad (HIT) family protein